MPIGTAHASTHRMTGAQFRSFQETRPDHERWELVKGVPVMMVPPTIAHQRIADNLTRLLNDALARHPEPDVMVMDADYEPRQRFVDRAYVVAEIVSDIDNEPVPGEKEPWIAIKRRLYLAHPPCEAVILIDPYRVEVRIDLRTQDGWASRRLTSLDERLTIPTCGQCLVGDVYKGTPLNRQRDRP